MNVVRLDNWVEMWVSHEAVTEVFYSIRQNLSHFSWKSRQIRGIQYMYTIHVSRFFSMLFSPTLHRALYHHWVFRGKDIFIHF